MGDFEVIQTGFSKADETINFGSRTTASESLFEISTLTSFKSNDEFSVGVSDVVLNSILKNGHLYLSIGKMLKVFKGAELSEIIFHASLGSTIVSMAVHTDKQLLVVCLETGIIKLLKIEEDGEFTSIFSGCLVEGAIPQNVYVDEMSEDLSGCMTKFLVIFQNGIIFRISVNETNKEENRFLVDTNEIFNLSCKVNLTSFLYPLIVTNGSSCNVFNVETHKCISDKPFQIKKIFPLRRKFLCLDFEGKLRRLCGLTMKYFLIDYDFLLEDFLVLQDGTKILAVTKPNEIGEFFLQLLEIDYEQIFSLKLKYTVHLVDINSTIDDVLFVSYIKCLNEKITELRLQTVYETEPESRYNRLVQRQRFDEAEAFAKDFNLNPSVVLKARAQFIVDKTECSSEDINTLITLMDSIDESYFNLQCCSNVDCSSLEDVRKILNYGFKISPKKWDERKEDILYLKKTLLSLLYRWYTFTVLTKNNDDIQSWLRFSECNLLEEIKYCLKLYQIEDAILIYNRMDEETIRSLNDDFIDDILQIFDTLPQELLRPFLPTFVVRTMSHLPAVLPLVVNWLHNKILYIEKTDKVNFPENGINMVEGILKLITVEERTGMTRCMRNRKSLDDMSHLSKGLQILKKLKKDYGIVVELIEYLSGSKAFISTLLKISLPPELYDDFLKKILYVYLIQNDMDPDTIFEEEIKKLLTYDDSWISTVEIVIRNIDSLDIKLNLTNEILLKSPIPWCDVTKRIAYRTLEFSHPLCEEISRTLNNEARLKVIKNDKYLINQRILDEEEEQFHRAVKRIIYVNEPQMIDDIFHLCETDDQYLKASFILANHFILKGDFDQAVSIVDRNKAELINSCAMKLFDYVEIIFEKTYHNTETKEKYYNVLPYLMKKVRSSTTEEWKMNDFEKYYRLIRGAYYFNKLLGADFTSRDFISPLHRKRKYKELIDTVVRNLNFASLCFNDILQHSEKIAYYLSEDKDEVLLRLCDCIKNYDILIKAGEYFDENESSAKNLSLMTTLFMKYLGYQDSSPFNATLFDNIHDETLPTTFGNLNCEDETTGIDKFLKGLTLGEKLITKAMVNGDSDLQIYEISNWINSCFYLIRPESTLHKELYPNLYCPKNMPSSTVLRTVQGCYQGFVDSIDTKKDFYSDYYKFFSTDTESQEDRSMIPDVSSLSSAVVTFCKEGQQLTAFSLLRCLLNSLLLHPTRDNKILNPLTSLLRDTCVLQLIPAVISAENIDLQLLYNLFLASRQSYRKYLVGHLQIHMRNDRKLNDLSRVGIMLLNVHNETKGREAMINSVKGCKWWRKLLSVHSKMTYNEFFVSTPGTRLRELINLEAIEVEDIRLYCRDFNLEVDDYFKEYLRSSLVNFKPKYDINKNIDDKRILVMKDDERVLSNKCRDIIDLIKDKKGTNTILEKMLKEVNFYYYEVFSIIYELLDNDTQASYCLHEGMLQFLMSYTRFSGPGQREIEEWTAKFPDAPILDPLSEFRFPFTPLLFTLDIWNIMRPEIDLHSYKLWFDAATLSETLKINDICVYAVKQLVSSGVLGNKSNEWIPQSRLGDLLLKVDECLQYMTNLEQAASAVYHLLNSIPNGADKVKAAELCLKYAIRYREENANNPAVEQAFVKVKNKFYNLSVWNILYKFNLANENYLRFFMQPEILIENLYMDERISKQTVSSIFKYSDINDAVEALSELFELDIQEIRFNILNRWLSSSQSVTTNTDVKFTLPTLDRASNQLNNDENLKRASYICTSGDQEYWESYLLQVILGEDENLDVQYRTLAFKANAAKCFCTVSDGARIVEVANLSYAEFLNYVDKLSLLSELESLGISLTIETLNAFSKRDLLKKLSHMGKPLAIKCMGTICITYSLEEPRYWEYIINSCIKLGMISQLKIYVDFLKDKCEEMFYINAWQVIIDKSFQQIAHVSENDLEETLVKNFLMIQSCPAVFSLNFEKIIEICVNLKKSEYAFLIVQYIPEEQRALVLKEILKNETDFSKLDSLKEKGLWGTYNLSRNNKIN